MISRRRYITVLSTLARRWNGAFAALVLWSVPTFASETIIGRVLAAGAPIVGSTVTLWGESTGALKPRPLRRDRRSFVRLF
jgi:hypothetical protein